MAQIADHADAQVNRVLVANKSDNEAERASRAPRAPRSRPSTRSSSWRRRRSTTSTCRRPSRPSREVVASFGRGRGVDARRDTTLGDERQKEVVLLRLELAGAALRRPYIISSTDKLATSCA